jgi:hypothetical protein
MEVLQFNRANLIESLTGKSIDPDRQEEENKNRHIYAFSKYLEALQAKSIVIEGEYTDGDYLDDFASFYVNCNHKYVSVCKRIHFFSFHMECEDFKKFILRMEDRNYVKTLNDNYLGFIVVRPLPEVIIGRTILKLPIDSSIVYPCTRKYNINFYGIELEINNSLAFQQQDEAIAACATVALWSAFHKTSELFQTLLPRASVITKSATSYSGEQRNFPSTGLSIQQMRNSIVSLGLEAQIYQQDLHYLLPIIYAYLKMGIPIILDVTLMKKVERDDKKDDGEIEKIKEEEYRYCGEHAITIVGYKCKDFNAGSLTGMNMKNNKISVLSVHDDQMGPFTKLNVMHDNEDGELFTIVQSTRNKHTGQKNIKPIGSKILSYDDLHSWIAIPNGIIVPVDDKIRIPYPRIFEYCANFSYILTKLHMNLMETKVIEEEGSVFFTYNDDEKFRCASEKLEWNIHLTTSNILKAEIRDEFLLISQSTDIDDIIRDNFERIMLKSHSKYVWRAKLTLLMPDNSQKNILDIYADASDTPLAFPMDEMIWYSSTYRYLYKNLADQEPAYLNDKKFAEECSFLKNHLN